MGGIYILFFLRVGNSKHCPQSKQKQAQESATERPNGQTFHTSGGKAASKEDYADITLIYHEQIVFNSPECLLCEMTLDSVD